MKLNGLKKLIVSLGLGAMLMLGATAVSASTGTELERFTEPDAATGFILENEAAIPEAYAASSSSKAVQTAATADSISFKWNKVSGASKYVIKFYYPNGKLAKQYKPTTATSVRATKLTPGTDYTIKISAQTESGSQTELITLYACTLFDKITVKDLSFYEDTFTFIMNPYQGYKVTYHNYYTNKAFTRYYENKNGTPVKGFTTTPKENAFYKVTIRPYIRLNGQKVYSKISTGTYLAQQPKLYKSTSNPRTISWKKVAGATSYSVYVKYPGESKYKHVKTTGATSYTLSNMKKNVSYRVKVIANKGKYHSANSYYYSLKLTSV